MEAVRITENELLAALASDIRQAPPHAMTRAELGAALGLGRTAIKDRLQKLADEGRLEVWRTTRVDVSGRPQPVPAYTIKPAANGKPKGKK